MLTDCTRLLAFYAGHGTDHRGRGIAQILAFTYDELEKRHDFIQWLFPLDAPSGVMPAAPVLDPACRATFAGDRALRARLREAFAVMLEFYGLALSDEEVPCVTRGVHFPARAAEWITPGNHNFLRLTRILRSLTLLGEGPLAAALHACLEEIDRDHVRTIGPGTLAHWRRAVAAG